MSSAADIAIPPRLWVQTSMFSLTLLIAVVGVPWYSTAIGFEWSAWIAFALYYFATGLAITAGYHRLWSHNSYKAHPVLKVIFALLGAGAIQNSILIWASGHRDHHRHVDDPQRDPYSAHKGLWYSHVGWMLRDYPSGRTDLGNVPDLQRDAVVQWQHNHYLALVLIMNIGPPLLMGLLTGDYLAHFLLVGVLRLVVTHHCTFFINSLAHYWGRQPYSDSCSARDNSWLALFTYGEGYHNYHHRFQNDYRNGVRWWHFDPTKWLIFGASLLGLARDLRRVSTQSIEAARKEMQHKTA